MIRGTVLATGGRLPIAGAIVNLVEDMGMPAGAARRYVTKTDENGRFEFANAPITRYKWSATATGYRAAEGPLTVTSTLTSLPVEMDKMGTISGRVLSPNGRPLSGIPVSVLSPWGYEEAPVISDSNGRFTAGVAPGRYFLVAHPPQSYVATTGDVKGTKTGWVNVFYPSSATRDGGQVSIVRSGDAVVGLDIRIHEDPVVPLAGLVTNAVGKPTRNATVSLFSADSGLRFSLSTASGEDGKYVFPAVPRGNWNVVAEITEGTAKLQGFSPVVVSDHPVESLQIKVFAPFTVTGKVTFLPPSGRSAVYLTQRTAAANGQRGAMTREDGSFTITDVYPGRYLIVPAGYKPGQYVASIRLGSIEVLGQEVGFTGTGDPPITVEYKNNGGLVKGIIRDGKRGAVILVPVEESLRESVFIQSTSSDPEGRFEFPAVRPGDYYGFAFAAFEFRPLNDPVFFNQLINAGSNVHVAEGESMTFEPVLSKWPW